MRQRAKQLGPAPVAVIVMGVSGCGKSTVGELLAKALECPFIEGDALHDRSAVEKMKNGISLTDEDRWPWLDRIARAASLTIARSGRVVVACSALREVYRDRLRARISGTACFLLLDNSHDELMRRLVARADHFMPANMLDSQLATLERPTVSETAKTLLSDISPDDLCAKAVDWLKGDLGVDRSG